MSSSAASSGITNWQIPPRWLLLKELAQNESQNAVSVEGLFDSFTDIIAKGDLKIFHNMSLQSDKLPFIDFAIEYFWVREDFLKYLRSLASGSTVHLYRSSQQHCQLIEPHIF